MSFLDPFHWMDGPYTGEDEDDGAGYENWKKPVAMRKTNYITTSCLEQVHETEKARLIRDHQGQFWVPKSISTFRFNESGSYGTLRIPDWFRKSYISED
jgi:hypothetical protein